MSVRSSVNSALKKRSDIPLWQRQVIYSLADMMDTMPSASAATTLWQKLNEVLGDEKTVEAVEAVDDIATRRAARRAAAG
jgi:hypothetical protein